MANFLFKSMRWSLEVSRSTTRLSVNFHASIPRQRFSTHTLPRPLSSKSSRSRQTQRSSFSSKSKYSWPPGELPAQTSNNTTVPEQLADLTEGFNDAPTLQDPSEQKDWARSFHGLSVEPFAKEVTDILLAPIKAEDVEVKPDGILYLPEIKYRRILNRAFGPGGWGLAPRGETIVTPKAVTREYALVALGRLISIARGEQDYFSPEGIPTAAEGCKSNALTRCCKDLGIASELWDPRFIRKFIADNIKDVWVEHLVTKKRKKIYIRKGDKVGYPWKESRVLSPSS